MLKNRDAGQLETGSWVDVYAFISLPYSQQKPGGIRTHDDRVKMLRL